jgi:hypothetical protein
MHTGKKENLQVAKELIKNLNLLVLTDGIFCMPAEIFMRFYKYTPELLHL